MMLSNNPYEKMRSNAIATATREELTLMLYEGALKFCNQAISALTAKDYMLTNELIIKVENIIREFQLTLDRKYEVSKNFDAMYAYMYEQLVLANINKDMAKLEEVRDFLRDFRDMWKDAMKLARQQTPAGVGVVGGVGSMAGSRGIEI